MPKYKNILNYQIQYISKCFLKNQQRNFFHKTNLLLKKDYYSKYSNFIKKHWEFQISHHKMI